MNYSSLVKILDNELENYIVRVHVSTHCNVINPFTKIFTTFI